MPTYVVGDIQGCFDPLRRLLDDLKFDPAADQLWAVGDFVNRGPDSLGVLRFLRSLGDSFLGVLGNHDLHLLAVAFGARGQKRKDTLEEVLEAPDLPELTEWLLRTPVARYERGYLMVHAGVIPSWNLDMTLQSAEQLHAVLRGGQAAEFFEMMYGDTPEAFHESMEGWQRLRAITNVLTRIRFCTADGKLDMKCKKEPAQAPRGMKPWYAHPHRRTADVPILFGHWAALGGRLDAANLFALDTACVWGDRLTALRLEDHQRFHCSCA